MFQRRLFVCLFVCTISSERLNIGWLKLAVRYVVQKFRPSLKVNVKCHRPRSPGRDKKRKTAESSPLTMHIRACAVARPYAASSNRRCHCVATHRWQDKLRRWENQRMLSSLLYNANFFAVGRTFVIISLSFRCYFLKENCVNLQIR